MLELLLFSSESCSVCKALEPKLSGLARKFQIPFRQIDISRAPQESGKFLVFSVPTLVIIENGREINRWTGVFSISDISSYLSRILETRMGENPAKPLDRGGIK